MAAVREQEKDHVQNINFCGKTSNSRGGEVESLMLRLAFTLQKHLELLF